MEYKSVFGGSWPVAEVSINRHSPCAREWRKGGVLIGYWHRAAELKKPYVLEVTAALVIKAAVIGMWSIALQMRMTCRLSSIPDYQLQHDRLDSLALAHTQSALDTSSIEVRMHQRPLSKFLWKRQLLWGNTDNCRIYRSLRYQLVHLAIAFGKSFEYPITSL